MVADKLSAVPARPWLNPKNKRLGVRRAHGTHVLDPGHVRQALSIFRRYLHSAFLRLASSAMGRKMLTLALWVVGQNDETKEELEAYGAIFKEDAATINMIIDGLSKKLQGKQRKPGCLTAMLKEAAPKLLRYKREMAEKSEKPADDTGAADASEATA